MENNEKGYNKNNKENENFIFIFGVNSISNNEEIGFLTNNNFEVIYDKNIQKYFFEINIPDDFDSYKYVCNFLKNILDKFTYFIKTDCKIDIDCFLSKRFFNIDKNLSIYNDTLEDLYITFKIMVYGYCSLVSEHYKKDLKE